ncbi:MAG: choice-of-anchor D domain-containing protein [Pseudomonadota bacterium]
MRLVALATLFATGCIGLELTLRDSGKPAAVDDSSPEVTDYGDLHVYPTSVDFGDVQIGRSGESTVILSYSGDGDVIISEATVTGGASTMVISDLTGLPTAISVGTDVVVDLTFSPSAVRDYRGSLVFTTDAADAESVSVPLEGAGVGGDTSQDGADISINPAAIDFGTVDTSSLNRRTVSVSNIGNESLFLIDIVPGDSTLGFELDYTLPMEFDPGESREVTILWQPGGIGSLSSSMEFQSDSPGEESLLVPVVGQADDICDVCAPMISVDTGGSDDHAMSFMSFQGLYNDAQDVRVTNSGDQLLTVSGVYVNNDTLWTDGTFSTNWGGSSVALDPWQSTTVRVTYRATGTALDLPAEVFDQNILHILSDAANEPDYAIALTGTAI